MKNFVQWMEDVRSDDLQNELVLILHHVGDIEKALHQGQVEYALMGLKDVKESVHRISRGLNPSQQAGLQRTTHES
jgi:hypothetical protein